MFKFVFCALFAVAAAKPDLLLTPQLAPLTTYLAPATTTITKEATGFVSQGPLVYSSPLAYAHYIKKRSVPLTYYTPSTYLSNPLGTTWPAPLVQTAQILPAALPITTTHFIKKRSAPILATSYIAPTTYTTPWVSPTLAATPLVSSPLIAPTPFVTQPVAYASHLIKKRSVPLVSTYTAPAAITYESRFDLRGAPYVGTYASPLAYSGTIPAYTHII